VKRNPVESGEKMRLRQVHSTPGRPQDHPGPCGPRPLFQEQGCWCKGRCSMPSSRCLGPAPPRRLQGGSRRFTGNPGRQRRVGADRGNPPRPTTIAVPSQRLSPFPRSNGVPDPVSPANSPTSACSFRQIARPAGRARAGTSKTGAQPSDRVASFDDACRTSPR